MPAFMLVNKIDYVIDSIMNTTEITDSTLKWAESRRDAIKALTQIAMTIGPEIDLG